MKIVLLTPGTGNFHCGNCIRDQALAPALRRLGHDAIILPMYLPILAEGGELDGDRPLFFGGINVYLQQKLSVFRHTPRWVDRAFDARGLLRWMANKTHMTRARDLGEMTLAMLQGEQSPQRKELDRLLDWLAGEEKPQLVSLANLLLAGLARPIKQKLGVPVFCTLHGEDAFLDSLAQPWRERAWELLAERVRDIDGFIAVSHYYGDRMRERLGLDPARVRVIYNGIDLEGYEPAAAPPATPTVGYLARMMHGKGLTTLVEAFIELRRRERTANLWLRVGGSMTPADEPYVEGLRSRLAEHGLGEAVRWSPNMTRAEKLAFLKGLTVFSTPATYGEAFGLYVLEALAAGVPVVQPRHGAFPELLEATGGGVLCEPDDPGALADALESLLADPDRVRGHAERGRRAVFERFGVDRMAREIGEFYRTAVA